ncbi:MAG: hypothetical protein P8J55_04550 [Pseudomonadales bacterium]|nr:hypothetical protein [Pseudomonadales bacterium]
MAATGQIRFPKDLIEAGSLYLVSAMGGQDVDIGDDDHAPTRTM